VRGAVRVLLSNDDGYFAQGLNCLYEAVISLPEVSDVSVVAPERDRSGVSNSLTLDRPLSLRQAPNGFYYVNGTPTDCVHLAVTGMLDQLPDVVISGINHGANMGDDTVYSGTVAAATEGYLLGMPALAISLAGSEPAHYKTASGVAVDLLQKIARQAFMEPTLLNVNVPDVPAQDIAGMEVTRLGKRHKAEPVIRGTTPRGDTVYWVGAAGPAQEAGEGTDFYAVENNKVSVTPLQLDLTHSAQLDMLGEWLSCA